MTLQAITQPGGSRAYPYNLQQPDTRAGNHILLLCKDLQASAAIAQSLPHLSSTHARSAEEALSACKAGSFDIAFVDCDMPRHVLRKIRDAGRNKATRIIGLRGSDTLRPLKLLTEQLIISYVRTPIPLSVLTALVRWQGHGR